jgi:signal transduction histidine kinase
LTGIAGVGVIVLIIPIAIRHYVGRPLAELSRRVTRFSGDDIVGTPASDEVELLTEEFRRLDCQLKTARDNLLKENERKLDLERRLRHSDKLATIGTLASGLAHEIGTPLNIIRGRAEHLLHARDNPRKTGEGLETIINQIDRITRIVKMLLDFGGRRERLRSPRDIRQIVQSTVCLLETEARRRGVEFDVVMGDAPLIVSCNSDQLQQVFVNLGVNALDAMAEHGGKLRIAAERSEEDGQERVRLVFEDTGPGIADEYRDRVFDPFFTTKEPGKGTGMGLAVSQSIIREHEGEIVAEAHTGGARFAVTLPLLPASGQADRMESA